MRRKGHRDLSRYLKRDDLKYPVELEEPLDYLISLNDAIYGHLMAEQVTKIWFDHAMQPGGDQNISLQGREGHLGRTPGATEPRSRTLRPATLRAASRTRLQRDARRETG